MVWVGIDITTGAVNIYDDSFIDNTR